MKHKKNSIRKIQAAVAALLVAVRRQAARKYPRGQQRKRRKSLFLWF